MAAGPEPSIAWQFRFPELSIRGIVSTAEGDGLVVNTNSGPMFTLDPLSGDRTLLFGHERAVTSGTFSSDGQRMLSTSEDGTVHIRARDGTLLDVIDPREGPAHTATFLPGEQRILVGFSKRVARVFWTDIQLAVEHARDRVVPAEFIAEERQRYEYLLSPQ